MIFHQLVEDIFARVSEWGMAQVMRQTNAFHKIGICSERGGEATPDLRHFQRMRESRAVVIALVVDEYLRFVFQAPEG